MKPARDFRCRLLFLLAGIHRPFLCRSSFYHRQVDQCHSMISTSWSKNFGSWFLLGRGKIHLEIRLYNGPLNHGSKQYRNLTHLRSTPAHTSSSTIQRSSNETKTTNHEAGACFLRVLNEEFRTSKVYHRGFIFEIHLSSLCLNSLGKDFFIYISLPLKVLVVQALYLCQNWEN